MYSWTNLLLKYDRYSRLRVLGGHLLSIHSRYMKALAQQEHQVSINICEHVICDDRD